MAVIVALSSSSRPISLFYPEFTWKTSIHPPRLLLFSAGLGVGPLSPYRLWPRLGAPRVNCAPRDLGLELTKHGPGLFVGVSIGWKGPGL